ncbi:hypothetical protein G7Y89_g7645 [Cudoniella acicularis]|uniref:Uncharacterized protein n=1 Tax=Cudoniella acicularis TaxID=354080 RepID=A0A8H4RI53_9HELO|nr:hypothetical protein G7Y89_g7645 [Cudoniella acicularis]
MHAGYFAAINIHQQILERQLGKTPKFVQFPEIPPLMALAVGENALSYGPVEGTKSGKDVMKMFFGEDLGHSICWNYLQLSKDTREGEKDEALDIGVENLDIGATARVTVEA